MTAAERPIGGGLELVDTHAHLDEPVFDPDRAAVITRAAAAGVRRIVNIGYRPARWRTSTELARAHPGIALALGLHPQQADEFGPETLDDLAAAIAATGARAIGEIGLDYFRDGPPPAAQQQAFAAQIELALRLGLPIVVHQRAAEADCAAVLAGALPALRVVLHSFDGTWHLARLGLERGYYFGVGGLMTRPAAAEVRAILAELPLDRLLLETDSPYLVPAGLKQRRNEPANLPRIAACLAELRGLSIEEVARQTTANAERAFGLPPAPRAAPG